MWGWVKTCFYQLFYCHSLEWERNGRNRKCHCHDAWDFLVKKDKTKQQEHREEMEIEENGKMKEAVNNNARFNRADLPAPSDSEQALAHI